MLDLNVNCFSEISLWNSKKIDINNSLHASSVNSKSKTMQPAELIWEAGCIASHICAPKYSALLTSAFSAVLKFESLDEIAWLTSSSYLNIKIFILHYLFTQFLYLSCSDCSFACRASAKSFHLCNSPLRVLNCPAKAAALWFDTLSSSSRVCTWLKRRVTVGPGDDSGVTCSLTFAPCSLISANVQGFVTYM